MEKVTIGDCVLYHGDAMEIMQTLDKVDCVVCDPPYKLTSGGGTPSEAKRMSGKFNLESYNNGGSIVECNIDWPDFIPEMYKVLRENAHMYLMCNNRHIQNMLNASESAGFKFHNLLVWDKGTMTPNRWYMKNLEYIGFFYKGKAFFINDCGSKQLYKVPNVLNAKHPTEKPYQLMSLYIGNSTQEGETVLDPFMGSGSTGVACAKLGRKFVGIEINKEYFDLACERIDAAYCEPLLI